ncbi:hypothetical protein ACWKT5_38685 [Streptomyces avermitilis]
MGDGSNRRPAVHRLDAAQLFRPALGTAPAARAEAEGHFGRLGDFLSLDVPASSALTQKQPGRHRVRPALIPVLEAGHDFDD